MFVRGDSVMAPARRLELSGDDRHWYRAAEAQDVPLTAFAQVFCARTRPSTRNTSTRRCCSIARRPPACVSQRPGALRDWNEKLSILRFPNLAPPTLIASDMGRIHDFIAAQGDVILKKLDGMGGAMIFRVAAGDVNRNVIVEAITDLGDRTIMAQRYIPEIAKGDKRVLVIDGKPFSHCSRASQSGRDRGNLAAGGGGGAAHSDRDREIARP